MPHIEKLQEGEVKQIPDQRPISINVGNRFTVPVHREEDIAPTLKLIEDTLHKDPELAGEVLKSSQDREAAARMGEGLAAGTFSPEARLGFLGLQSTFPLRRGGLDDIGMRFDLARSDRATEKLMKLNEAYPEAEFSFANDLDGNTTILMRRKGEATGIEIESPDFSQGDLGALASGILRPETVAEILTFMATKATGLKGTMMKAFAAGAIGKGIDSRIEELRGFELSTGGEIIEQMAFTGIAGAAGVFLFDPTARVRNKIRGTRGLTSVSEEGRRGMAAAQSLGQSPRLPGSVHPKLRNAQNQSYATSPRMEKAVDDQLHEAAVDFAAFAEDLGDITALDDEAIQALLSTRVARITAALDSPPNMTWEDSGGQVKRGMDKVFEIIAEVEGRDYMKAMVASKVGIYDIGPSKKLQGLLAFGKRGPVTIKGQGYTLHDTINVTPVKSTELKDAMKRLNQLDDSIGLTKRPDGEENPLDIMIGLRSEFFSMMEDQALKGNDRRIAALVHGSLTESMRNPFGVDAAGRALWRRAANRTKFKEDMLSKDYVRLIANSDQPEDVARYLADSGNYTAIRDVRRMLRATGQGKKWDSVQQAFKTLLFEGPSQIRGILTGKATRATKALDLLMPPAEQKVYLDIGDKITAMGKSTIAKMLSGAKDEALRLTELANSGSRREILAFLEDVGGKASPRGRALAAGFLTNLANKATSAGTLKLKFNKDIFAEGLQALRKRGIMDDVFDEKTLAKLTGTKGESFEEAIAFLPDSMGVGDSIQAAEAGSSAFGIFGLQPIKSLQGQRTFIKNDVIAWMFTTPATAKFFVGSFKAGAKMPKDVRHAQAIGGALGVILENMTGITESIATARPGGGFGSLDETSIF